MTLTVLVTGAAGFIGSHLLPKLVEEGYEIIALDRHSALEKLYVEDYDYRGHIVKFPGDICTGFSFQDELRPGEYTILNNEGKSYDTIDSMIHLAAMAAPRVAQTKPEETFRTNVYGTYNVLRRAKAADAKRFIFASTAHVYGISPKYMPTDENHPLSLGDAYTTSKILGEQLCELFYQNHDIPYTVLRLFNGYGPGQSSDYFIPAMINKAIAARSMVKTSIASAASFAMKGKGITKDFVYVDDIVDAIAKALSSNYVGYLNIGTGIQTTLEYVAGYISKYFDVGLSLEETDDKGPTHMQCDPSRAERILGWRAKTKIEEGLKKTCDYFKSE